MNEKNTNKADLENLFGVKLDTEQDWLDLADNLGVGRKWLDLPSDRILEIYGILKGPNNHD